jgi:hypothetical protein
MRSAADADPNIGLSLSTPLLYSEELDAQEIDNTVDDSHRNGIPAALRDYRDRNGWWIEFGYETNRRQVRRCVISLKTILEHYGRFSDFSPRILGGLEGAHGQRQPKGEVERPSCSPISG